MDAILAALPQAGIAGVLAAIILYVLKSNHSDREQHARLRAKADESHDKSVAALRAEVSELREEVREVRRELEAERRARWKAEDDAAKWRRAAGVSDGDDGDSTDGP